MSHSHSVTDADSFFEVDAILLSGWWGQLCVCMEHSNKFRDNDYK